MGFGKREVPFRLIIVVKNKNCQAYLCVFSVFPSSPFSLRFSFFNVVSFYFPRHRDRHVVLNVFNSLISGCESSLGDESAEPQRKERESERALYSPQ